MDQLKTTDELVELPVGMPQFEQWSNQIIEKCGSIADPDSMRYVLATAIMHAPPDASSLPDSYFISRVRKAAANQVAAQVFQDIKIKQQAAQEAAKTQAEVTANTQAESSDVKED